MALEVLLDSREAMERWEVRAQAFIDGKVLNLQELYPGPRGQETQAAEEYLLQPNPQVIPATASGIRCSGACLRTG